MTPFNYKLAAVRWIYGALVPAAGFIGVGATTGNVNWRVTFVAALSGLISAMLVDLHAYLNSQPDPGAK